MNLRGENCLENVCIFIMIVDNFRLLDCDLSLKLGGKWKFWARCYFLKDLCWCRCLKKWRNCCQLSMLIRCVWIFVNNCYGYVNTRVLFQTYICLYQMKLHRSFRYRIYGIMPRGELLWSRYFKQKCLHLP